MTLLRTSTVKASFVPPAGASTSPPSRGSSAAIVSGHRNGSVTTRAGKRPIVGGERASARTPASSGREVEVAASTHASVQSHPTKSPNAKQPRKERQYEATVPTARDRVVQASLKLVLEPILEADFKPCSYGFRPRRRAQDAIAEIHFLASPGRNYLWVFEADIKACFDEIDHQALMRRVRRRIEDKRILALVKAFLRAGVLSEDGISRNTNAGTPQGGILSPLLANIALSVLDEHFEAKYEALGPEWTRSKRRRAGHPIMRLVRYGDDFVILVAGNREHAEALKDEVSGVLAPIGLRLSEEKTRVCHIDEGFDFLGWRIQRRAWRGRTGKRQVYTYPSKKSLLSLFDRVRILTRRRAHRTLADLLKRVNPLLRGWCNYFRHGVCKRTFGYVDHYSWWRIVTWIRKRHAGPNWGTVRRRYLPDWEISDDGISMFRPRSVAIVRYRYRGKKIPTPWASHATPSPQPAA